MFLDEYIELYNKFKSLPLVIEGPEFDSDYSYYLVDKCKELKELEKGVLLTNFRHSVSLRDYEMEFRILQRINLHKLHYQNLFKS